MKKTKLYKIILIIYMAFSLTMLNVISFAYTLGDMDGNGKITASDARTALQIAGISKLYDKKADLNLDGKVIAAEARQILRIASKTDHFTYNGYTVYNQKDYGRDIPSRGCSVTSISIVLSKYGKYISPEKLWNNYPLTLQEISNKLKNYNIGSNVFKAYTKTNVNLNLWKNEINKTLNNGKPVIALVRNDGTNLYTTTSHYIVLVGFYNTSRARTLVVLDPNGGRIRVAESTLDSLVDNFILAPNNGNEMGFVCIK